MHRIYKKSLLSILIVILFFPVSFHFTMLSVEGTSGDVQLTLYTYESLLADPGYDFVEGYANYSGIPKDSIQVIALSDANSIVTRLIGEKDSPAADVVIGLDNILVYEAKNQGVLQPYNSPMLENISSDLITNLDPDHYLLPFDYGIIAFNYDNLRINSSTVDNLENLTLNDFLTLELDKKLVIEDPTLSSPGLGFLLSTIAIYGDPSIEFDGLLNLNWRDWWENASSDIRVAPSWGAAFDIYYEEGENRPLMISYGSSPAYTVCQGWGDNLKAFVSHENGTSNAWLQIEGIGLTEGAPHQTRAEDFIDWFLGEELQNQIPENNWMYPANQNANISSCFEESVINTEEVFILNDLITPTMLETNLERWQNEWEESMIANTPVISTWGGWISFSWFTFMIFGVSWLYIKNEKKRDER